MSADPEAGHSRVTHAEIGAIIWDYDGTLVDTREKNLRVTRRILETVARRNPDDFPVLRSLEAYASANARSLNWRDLYRNEFGFGEDLIDRAGWAWTTLQLDDATPLREYEGIRSLLVDLRDVPHGIVSQNSGKAIAQVLEANDLRQYFRTIIGYEEVDLRRQKPAPDGLVMAIDALMPDSGGVVVYIGDHETDALCARNANDVLQKTRPGVRVTSVGAAYSSDAGLAHWNIKPDHEAMSVFDIMAIVASLAKGRAERPPPLQPLSREVQS